MVERDNNIEIFKFMGEMTSEIRNAVGRIDDIFVKLGSIETDITGLKVQVKGLEQKLKNIVPAPATSTTELTKAKIALLLAGGGALLMLTKYIASLISK